MGTVIIVWREFDEPDADVAIDTAKHSRAETVDRIVAALEANRDDWLPSPT